MLLISLFVALCVKLHPDTHKGMHLVLASKLGVTGMRQPIKQAE
jgi:hypothetical protein